MSRWGKRPNSLSIQVMGNIATAEAAIAAKQMQVPDGVKVGYWSSYLYHAYYVAGGVHKSVPVANVGKNL